MNDIYGGEVYLYYHVDNESEVASYTTCEWVEKEAVYYNGFPNLSSPAFKKTSNFI